MAEATSDNPDGAPLEAGWVELAGGRWAAAFACFERAVAAKATAEAYEGLSWAAWWLDDADVVFAARDRAYRRHKQRGERAAAARMATWLACDELDFHGAVAVASGWLRRARRLLGELEWVEADAENLPFADGEFDVVTSSLGAIFAPDHRRVADELLRVSRPGGTIGMLNFTPEGLAGDFFGTLGPYMPPPPPGALPPLLWGNEDHVRDLLGDRVASLEMTRNTYVERAASPHDYVALFTQTFGPAVAIRSSLADDPPRAAAFDRDFLEFAARANTGDPAGPAEYRYEYLLAIARTRRA